MLRPPRRRFRKRRDNVARRKLRKILLRLLRSTLTTLHLAKLPKT